MAGTSGEGIMPQIRVPTGLTLAGLALGLVLGIALSGTAAQQTLLAIADPVGDLWLRALKMTILPLVAGLLFTGIMQTAAASRAGKFARKTLGLFLTVLAASAAIGLIATPLLLKLAPIPELSFDIVEASDTGPLPGLGDFLRSMLPDNIFAAAAEGAMLPFVIFMALFALAATRLPEPQRDRLAALFEALAGAMLVVIGWVLALAPIGVFALALGMAAKAGTGAIGALAHYILLVSAVGAIVLLLAYLTGILAGRKSPASFARSMIPAQAVAISTQSSLASLPAMIAGCRRLGIGDASSEFVLPLAVALFRATSPAMNLAVAIYAAHLAGVEITLAAMLAGAGVALLISLSTVSLPGTVSFIASIGPIAIAMGVPVEPLALLVAVEMLPDIMRTLGNVTMDVAVTAVADRDGEASAHTSSGAPDSSSAHASSSTSQ